MDGSNGCVGQHTTIKPVWSIYPTVSAFTNLSKHSKKIFFISNENMKNILQMDDFITLKHLKWVRKGKQIKLKTIERNFVTCFYFAKNMQIKTIVLNSYS